MKPPCHKCEERHIGCHSECEKHIQWVKERKEIQESIRKENETINYLVESGKRLKRIGYRQTKPKK